MQKRILIILLLIFATCCIFNFTFIKDMNYWEKKIKKLDFVESLNIEIPDHFDDCWTYNLKIYLNNEKCIYIENFNPYEKKFPGDFYIERIGNIVPITWGYDFHSLNFHSFKFKYIYQFFNDINSIVDLLKQYDEILMFIQNLPTYNIHFPYELVNNSSPADKKPVLNSWNNYSSPYIYSNYNKKWKYWEEYKLFQMPIKEYNEYMISIDKKWLCIDE